MVCFQSRRSFKNILDKYPKHSFVSHQVSPPHFCYCHTSHFYGIWDTLIPSSFSKKLSSMSFPPSTSPCPSSSSPILKLSSTVWSSALIPPSMRISGSLFDHQLVRNRKLDVKSWKMIMKEGREHERRSAGVMFVRGGWRRTSSWRSPTPHWSTATPRWPTAFLHSRTSVPR